MLALPFIALLGEKIITLIAVFGLFSGYFFEKRRNILVILLVVILLIPIKLTISDYKEFTQALNYPNSELIESRWNSYSRIDLVKSSFTRYAPGLSSVYRKRLPEQIGLLIDGSNMNAITDDGSFANYLPTSIAYSLVKNPNVLILNPKGGLDIVTTLHNDATVTAVEPNALIVDIVNEYSDLYNKVNLVNTQARSYLKKAGKFDIIILSLSGNVYGSGLYGLSQDYELTVEAFQEYYDHLTDNGYLIITRWLSYPPRETLRLFSLALQVTNQENIALFRSWTTTTLLIGKNLDSIAVMEFCEKNKFDIIYLPIGFTPNKYAKFSEPIYYQSVNEILNNKEFYNDYIFDVTPVTDNKPFYYNFFKISKFRELISIIGKNWQPFNDPGFLLLFLLFQSVILSLVFVLLPLKFTKPKSYLLFFFFIGLAYLFVEIVFIQKFVLLLNNVTHSAAVVILTMLLFSSLGALFSKFKLKNVLTIIVLLIVIYFISLQTVINYVIALPLLLRLIISGLIIAPLAFFMGMPFPLAIEKLKKKEIPWALAINGSASVLSTILAILIAIFVGYSAILIVTSFLYLICIFVINN